MDKYYYYHSYHEALKGLPAKTRYIIREAIDRYMFDDLEPVFVDTLSNSIWLLILPTLKLSKVRYANGKQNRSKTEANLKQNRSKVEGNPEVCSSISKEKGERIKEKGEEKKPPKGGKEKTACAVGSACASSLPRFKKPSVDEVRDYINENGYHVNPNDFVDFYESKGWLVGKSPMKDWKAAVRTWDRKERAENPGQIEEKPQKPVPKVSQCPRCGSYEMEQRLDYAICSGCGTGYIYNRQRDKWEQER